MDAHFVNHSEALLTSLVKPRWDTTNFWDKTTYPELPDNSLVIRIIWYMSKPDYLQKEIHALNQEQTYWCDKFIGEYEIIDQHNIPDSTKPEFYKRIIVVFKDTQDMVAYKLRWF
jgi:hypothetical protein